MDFIFIKFSISNRNLEVTIRVIYYKLTFSYIQLTFLRTYLGNEKLIEINLHKQNHYNIMRFSSDFVNVSLQL